MPSPLPINLSMPEEIFLPVEIMAVALNISIEPRGTTISIYRDSGSRVSPRLLRPSGGWKDFGFDFLRYDVQEQTFLPRLLTSQSSKSATSSQPIASSASTSSALQNTSSSSTSQSVARNTQSANALSNSSIAPTVTTTGAGATTTGAGATTTTTAPATTIDSAQTATQTAPVLAGSATISNQSSTPNLSALTASTNIPADGGTAVPPPPQTIYNRAVLLGGGAHWGSYDLDYATTMVGGTPPKSGRQFGPLTYSSAFFNAVNVNTGAHFYGGTNFLKGFHDDHLLNGYPTIGFAAVIPFKKWTIAQFSGGGFTKAVPTGGGSTRFLYQRLMNITEASYKPNRHLTTSLATIEFKDTQAVKLNTREGAAYVETYTTWKSRLTELSALGVFGGSKTSATLSGASYAVDIRARRSVNKVLSVFSAFDRYSPNFTNPQITSNYFNRQDVLVGANLNFHSRIGYGASYSNNLTNLQFFKPDQSQTVSMSSIFAPFKSGPQINITGLETFQTKGTALASDATASNNASKIALGTIGLSQVVGGTQLFANVVSIAQTDTTNTTTNITTINLNGSRTLSRFGRVNLNAIFSNQKVFQLTALFTAQIRGASISYGPGYSTNGINSRYTFIFNFTGRPPLVGNISSTYASLLPQTVSTGRLEKIIWLNKNHRAPSGLVGLANQIPQGSLSGIVIRSSDFPILQIKGSPVIENVAVLLDDHVERPCMSDKKGSFHFEHVSPGMHKISLDLSTVPANLAITSPDFFYVRVTAFKDTAASFALSAMGQLEGNLVAGTGVDQANLANTRVYLVDKKGLETISDLDGSYRITDIPAGTYDVKVDAVSLGPEIEVVPSVQKIIVTELGVAKVDKFVIGRKVQIKQF